MPRKNHGTSYQIMKEYRKLQSHGIFVVKTPTGSGKSYDTAEFIADTADNGEKCVYVTPQKKNLDEEERLIRKFSEEYSFSVKILRFYGNPEFWNRAFRDCERDSSFRETMETVIDKKLIPNEREERDKKKLRQYKKVFVEDGPKNSLYTDSGYLEEAAEFLTKKVKLYLSRTYPELSRRKEALCGENPSEPWVSKIFPYVNWKKYDVILMSEARFQTPFDDFLGLPIKNFYSNLRRYSCFFDESCEIKTILQAYLLEQTSFDLMYVFRQFYHFLQDAKSMNGIHFPEEFLQDTLELGEKYHFDQGFQFVLDDIESNQFPALLYNGELWEVLDKKNPVYMVWTEEGNCRLLTEKQCQKENLSPENYPQLIELIRDIDRWHYRFYSLVRSFAARLQQESNPEEMMDYQQAVYKILRRINFEASLDKESMIQKYSQLVASGALKKKNYLRASSEKQPKSQTVYDTGLSFILCYKEPNSNELQFFCYYQPVTAEQIVAKLAEQNHVFLLSANADSPSVLSNFSLSYFEQKNLLVSPNQKILNLYQQLREDWEQQTSGIKTPVYCLRTSEKEVETGGKKEKIIEVFVLDLLTGKEYPVFSPEQTRLMNQKVIEILKKEDEISPASKKEKSLYYRKQYLRLTARFKLFCESHSSVHSQITFGMPGLAHVREEFLNCFAAAIMDSSFLPEEIQALSPELRIPKLVDVLSDKNPLYHSFPYVSFSDGSENYSNLQEERNLFSKSGKKIFSYDARGTSGTGYNHTLEFPEEWKSRLLSCRSFPSAEKDYDSVYIMPITYIYAEPKSQLMLRLMQISELHCHGEVNKKDTEQAIQEVFSYFISNTTIKPKTLRTDSYVQTDADITYQNLGRINRTSYKNQEIEIWLDEENLSSYEKLDFSQELNRQNGWLQKRFLQALQTYVSKKPEKPVSSPNIISGRDRAYLQSVEQADRKYQKWIVWQSKDLDIGMDWNHQYSEEERKKAWEHRNRTGYSELLMMADVYSYQEFQKKGKAHGFSADEIDEFWEYCVMEKKLDIPFHYSLKNGHVCEEDSSCLMSISDQSVSLDLLNAFPQFKSFLKQKKWFPETRGFLTHGKNRFTLHPGANKNASGWIAEWVGTKIVCDLGGTILTPKLDQIEMTDLYLPNGSGIDWKNWQDPVINGTVRSDKNRGMTHLTQKDWKTEDEKMERAGVSRNLFVNLFTREAGEESLAPMRLPYSNKICTYYRIPALLQCQKGVVGLHPQARAFLENYIHSSPGNHQDQNLPF